MAMITGQIANMSRYTFLPWAGTYQTSFTRPERRDYLKNKRTVSEDVQARVYNALLVGKENALNRDELVSKIGESDRDIRTAIEILRHDKVILTLPTGKGYYIPRDDAQGRQETEKWLVSQNNRTKSIKAVERGAQLFISRNKKKDKGIPGQISMFGAGL